jgi:hypothetical protein
MSRPCPPHGLRLSTTPSRAKPFRTFPFRKTPRMTAIQFIRQVR